MENSAVYEDAVERIQQVYSSCSTMEQKQLVQILQEIAVSGYSATLENIWLADFKEVPVSIDRFICDPYYMGEVTRNGDGVYPFWKKTANEIFNSGNKYYEIILSGATRIGKTSTMTLLLAYMLYRLMLYRDPHSYFKKKSVSRFTIGFANLTKDLASGVGYREFQDTLKAIPFFNDHGHFSKSERNFYYIPEGDKIDIVAGSDASNFLGMQLWACLIGSTKILTVDGIKTLAECEGTYQTVYSLLDDGSLITATAPIVKTKEVTKTVKITLDDGSVFEGTLDHKVMLIDGSYKCLGELTDEDEILTFNGQ